MTAAGESAVDNPGICRKDPSQGVTNLIQPEPASSPSS
jgi:hypothetical protein